MSLCVARPSRAGGWMMLNLASLPRSRASPLSPGPPVFHGSWRLLGSKKINYSAATAKKRLGDGIQRTAQAADGQDAGKEALGGAVVVLWPIVVVVVLLGDGTKQA